METPQVAQGSPSAPPALRASGERAAKILRDPKRSLTPQEFVGKLYSKEEVARDEQRVRERKAEFEADQTESGKEAKLLADILEAIILSEGEESGWFGKDTRLFKTSSYDDVFNHADMVAEFNDRGNRHLLALAVDVTFGVRALEKKIERIFTEVNKGRMSELKYIHSKDKRVPRAVIGVSREQVLELAKLWDDEDFDALQKHPIQRAILEQLFEQLTVIARYAEKTGKNNVAAAYRSSLPIIARLLQDKSDIPHTLRTDKVSEEISRQVGHKFSLAK